MNSVPQDHAQRAQRPEPGRPEGAAPSRPESPAPSAPEGAELLWRPARAATERAHISAYMGWLADREGRAFADYEQLWRWSVEELERFWASIWERFGVRASVPYERVLDSRAMPGARWFGGARLNYAENLLARGPLAGSSETAVVHLSELRPLDTLTRGELATLVAQAAEGLRALGVAEGDRVAAYMPNIVETLIAFLACASVGAIWSSAAPELGARSVLDRFAQIEPKVLLAVDGYRYGGKDFDRMAALNALIEGLPGVEHVVLLPYLDPDASLATLPGRPAQGATSGGPARGATPGGAARGRPLLWRWPEIVRIGESAKPRFAQVPFEHPLWVLYSSGTTGLPKAIVHSHGGMLVEQLKKSYLHLDLHRGDRMLWYTTTAWMMWNFLVGCLLTDAAIVLFDGSPAPSVPAAGERARAGHLARPTDRLWQLAQETGVTCLGTSAGFIGAAMKEASAPDARSAPHALGTRGAPPANAHPPRERFDLSRLRAVGSTGSPLAPEGFRWVYEALGPDLWLYSTSGGTDVCTAFVGGCPLLPVYAGELQCRALGCDVHAYDARGRPVIEEVGELVVTQPMPSMPLFLWGDRGDVRYRESYFSTYPGVWRHGDWIRITRRHTAVIYGRSDATINRGGIRMGTSEIYRAVSAVPEVLDALVVDVPGSARGASGDDRRGAARGAGGDEEPRGGDALRMFLFVVLRDGALLDQELRQAIAARVREDCSPRHVPDEIVSVTAIPRTLSGKILEVPVKRILMGVPPEEAVSLDSLANPDALEQFIELASRRPATPGASAQAGP